MRIYILAIGLFLLLFPGNGLAETVAHEVYAQGKQAILQIRILDRDTGAKTAIGSGFAVAPGDLVITNYHVISELIYRPDQYHATYQAEDNRTGALALLAVDVIHDLAILKSDAMLEKFLDFSPRKPRQGEKLFAFGNPLDLGLTIVEGIYNGLLEKSLHEKIHFTGSLNPGMSGGPAVDNAGRVIGINVATAGNQISFLVPASYAVELQQKAVQQDLAVDFKASISRQLLSHQEHYLSRLLSLPLKSEEMGHYRLPTELAPYIKCWGDTRPKRKNLYNYAFRACSTNDEIYLSTEQRTGILKFRNELMSTTELNPTRFYNLLEEHFNNPHLAMPGDEDQVTEYQCLNDFVSHNGLDSKVVYCLREYKEYPGLYDSFMTATTLMAEDEALHTTLTIAGASKENTLNFSRMFLETIQWMP